MTRGQVMRIGLRVGLPVICVIVLGALSAICQEPTAEITGIVTDATGASVPAARIQVINLGTGVHWETESNKSGNYVFSNLPPADYRINVQKQGFSTLTRSGISLVVSQVARLDFQLSVGNTTESIAI